VAAVLAFRDAYLALERVRELGALTGRLVEVGGGAESFGIFAAHWATRTRPIAPFLRCGATDFVS
jgi:hypothetical protein